MSNLGKWNKFYENLQTTEAYGDSTSYRIGAEFLSDCATIEDWGCGKGWFRNFVPAEKYTGLDGSWSKFADKVVDLETYTSEVEGIFMRHVLEHNSEWQTVLANAMESFTKKFMLILFTPYTELSGVEQLEWSREYAVPTLAFNKGTIEQYIGDSWTYQRIDSPETYYGEEHIYFITKEKKK